MEHLIKDFIGIISYIFTLIGLSASIYHAYKAWRSASVLSWQGFDRLAKKLIRKIPKDGFCPDVIVTIGRGGAILGAILSGNLPKQCDSCNLPLIGVDRFYQWESGDRVEVKINLFDYSPLQDKKVLLIAGDIMTGETIRYFKSKINPYALEVRTACLLKGITTNFHPDYFAKEIPADFKTPWMYKGYRYSKDSREPVNCEKQNWWEKFRNRVC